MSYDPLTGCLYWRKQRGQKRTGDVAGHVDTFGYVVIRFEGKAFKSHRIAYLLMENEWPPNFIDHINGVRSDNRWINLRKATRQQNSYNKGLDKRSSTLIRNVYKKRNQYGVMVSTPTGRKYIGAFDDIELAELVAIEAQDKYHREYARKI